jgi:hypothetical protein
MTQLTIQKVATELGRMFWWHIKSPYMSWGYHITEDGKCCGSLCYEKEKQYHKIERLFSIDDFVNYCQFDKVVASIAISTIEEMKVVVKDDKNYDWYGHPVIFKGLDLSTDISGKRG